MNMPPDSIRGRIRRFLEKNAHLLGDPKAASAAYYASGRGYGFLGEYGELRLDLARHLLKELRK